MKWLIGLWIDSISVLTRIIIYQKTEKKIHAIWLGAKSQALMQYGKLSWQYRNFQTQYRNVHCLRFPYLERLNSCALRLSFAFPTSPSCPVKTLKIYFPHLNPNLTALYQHPESLSRQNFNSWFNVQKYKHLSWNNSPFNYKSHCPELSKVWRKVINPTHRILDQHHMASMWEGRGFNTGNNQENPLLGEIPNVNGYL